MCVVLSGIKELSIEKGKKMPASEMCIEKRIYRHENYFLIEIYKGVLDIDENGRLYRIINKSHNKKKSKIDKPIDQKMPNGYMGVNIKVNNIKHNIYMHRLMWMMHNGKIPEGKEINHKDGNKANNSIENLELVTSSENRKHAYDNNLIGKNWEHPNAHLTREDYVLIEKMLISGKSIRSISILLNHNWKTIKRIKISIEEGVLDL